MPIQRTHWDDVVEAFTKFLEDHGEVRLRGADVTDADRVPG